MGHDADLSPEDLFRGFPDGLAICHRVQQVISTIGTASVAVTKSQLAFRRRRGFAYLWRPGQYVDSDVPAVLSLALSHEVTSDRFKSVVHPSKNIWMHHIELCDVSQVDDEVRGWLADAYSSAG